MFLLIPWSVDVPQDRWPVVNWLIILVTIGVFCLQMPDLAEMAEQSGYARYHEPGEQAKVVVPGITGELMLNGWGLKGLFGHIWLHGGVFHLIGNMFFLWLFGNAVCAKLGNLKYLLLYVLLGVAAGVAHLLFSSGPALGASGAINGVVGMYLVLFYENEITCLFAFWFIVPYVRWYDVSGIWLILFWLFWDIVGAMGGSGSDVAYFAHLGGFATGFGIAFFLCYKGWITMERYEKSLWQAWQARRGGGKDRSEEYYNPLIPSMREMKERKPATMPPIPTPPPPSLKPIPLIDPVTGKVERASADDNLVIVGCACGKCIRATRQYAGQLVTCPHCKARVRVPDTRSATDLGTRNSESGSDGHIRLRCQCGKDIKVAARYAGATGKCPRCGARIKVPRLGAAGESA